MFMFLGLGYYTEDYFVLVPNFMMSFLLNRRTILYFVNEPYFLYAFFSCGTFRLLPVSAYYE